MKVQLHKMTLYICDLEDSLSLIEIQNLIRDRALNGVAVNCICRFADECIGERVEWDDDIDLNRMDCPASAWEKYFPSQTKPQTNADKIRAMTDEELADWLARTQIANVAEALSIAGFPWGMDSELHDGTKMECLEWLKQPAEDDC